MQSSRQVVKTKQKLGGLGRRRSCCAKALTCSSRLSVSSSEEEAESSTNSSERYPTISSIAHAMVQERLDQMIKERQQLQEQQQEARNQQDRWRGSGGDYRNHRHQDQASSSSKFIVMLAMEKSSYNPREDFRESIVQMITANRIYEPRDLRRLLNYYVSMNSEEYQGVILEVFHEIIRFFQQIARLIFFPNRESYFEWWPF